MNFIVLISFSSCFLPGFVQNLKVLASMSLNLKTKIQGLEFVKKYLKVLKFFLLQFLNICWNCLTFKTDILLNLFCICISDKAVWNSLKLPFEQFNVRFYWFPPPFLQYLTLEFANTWPWMSLKSPCIWLFLTCTNPVLI